MTDKSVEDIIESYASSLELPIEEQSTIDRIIEILATGASWSKDDKDNLRKLATEKSYSGDNPELMLLLYDILGEESNEGLAYGIQGIEALGRDPKKIVGRETPDRLVEYVISTSENLDELVELKDTLLIEGKFYPEKLHLQDTVNAKQHLINSLLLVANEVAYQLKDVNIKEVSQDASIEDLKTLIKQWEIRKEAHAARVMAYQAKGEKVDNIEALKELAVYESISGTYQDRGFTVKLMGAYFKIKYATDKPSIGEVPEDLKADYGWIQNSTFVGGGGINWDQFFRATTFGTKEHEWKKWERLKEKAKEEAERQKREDVEFLEKLFRDPWEAYDKELKILGVNKEMTYEQARSIFRGHLKERRSTFIRKDIGTPEYNAAMDEMKKIINAWEKVEPLYKINIQTPAS